MLSLRRKLLTRNLEKYTWHFPVFSPLGSLAWAEVGGCLPAHPVLSLLQSGSIHFLGWVDWGQIRWRRRVMRSEKVRKTFPLKTVYSLLGNRGDWILLHSVQRSKLNFQLLWGIKGLVLASWVLKHVCPPERSASESAGSNTIFYELSLFCTFS